MREKPTARQILVANTEKIYGERGGKLKELCKFDEEMIAQVIVPAFGQCALTQPFHKYLVCHVALVCTGVKNE